MPNTEKYTETNTGLLSANVKELQSDHAAIVEDLMGLSRQIQNLERLIELNEQKALNRQTDFEIIYGKINRLEQNWDEFRLKLDKTKNHILIILVVLMLGTEGSSAIISTWLNNNLNPPSTASQGVNLGPSP